MGNIGNSHAFLKYLLSIEPQLRRSKCTWLYGALEKLWQSSVTHKSDIKEVLWSQEGGLESFSLNKEPSIPCGLEQIFNQLHFMQGFKPKRFWDPTCGQEERKNLWQSPKKHYTKKDGHFFLNRAKTLFWSWVHSLP